MWPVGDPEPEVLARCQGCASTSPGIVDLTIESHHREEEWTMADSISAGSTVQARTLLNFCVRVFEKVGVSHDDAHVTADVLVHANLRGIDSHGVARLGRYVNGLQSGVMVANAQPKVVVETPTTITLDALAGLGQPVSHRAMQMAIEKAKQYGCGFAAVRNSNHYGIAGYYAMMALDHDMIGISTHQRRRAGGAHLQPRCDVRHQPAGPGGARRPGAALCARHGHQHRAARQAGGVQPQGERDAPGLGHRRAGHPHHRCQPGAGQLYQAGRRRAAAAGRRRRGV